MYEIPQIACGIIIVMKGNDAGAIGVFINTPEN